MLATNQVELSRPKDFHIRVSDNGGFIVRCEHEEKRKDGMNSYKSKEYVYDSFDDMIGGMKKFFKPDLKSREARDNGTLKSREK